MTPAQRHQPRIVSLVAILCCLSLIAGVIWASDRALEITDEAYYLLSAIYPDQILLYISAQHWLLAPLWKLTETLQGFRLTGAAILLGTAAILALGAVRVLAQLTDQHFSWLTAAGAAAAGGVGALLYVATIAPSPSYNLLASAGAYGGLGFALLAVGRQRLFPSLLLCMLGGLCLAVCFVSKPSAGVCAAFTVCVLILCLETGMRKLSCALAGLSGALISVAVLVLIQPAEPSVQDSFRGGLELFRMVQTEPIGARLIRYAVSLATSTTGALISFWPSLLLTIALLLYPRRWLAALTLVVVVLNVILEKNYLAGMSSYHRMAEAINALAILLAIIGFRNWSSGTKVALLFAGLLVLPFSVTIGTGNSIFTQIVITMAPWTVAATLLSAMGTRNDPARLLQQGVTAVFLILVSVQIASSFMREPYHLQQPLTAQTQPVSVGRLGALKVDKATARMLDDIENAKQTCAIKPGAYYLGLFNAPGLALAFEAIPPVSPWLNNSEQAATVLNHWAHAAAGRVVTVLAPEPNIDMSTLPPVLWPEPNGHMFCGHAVIPYDNRKIEIWASPIKPG